GYLIFTLRISSYSPTFAEFNFGTKFHYYQSNSQVVFIHTNLLNQEFVLICNKHIFFRVLPGL
ncbi:hypothetical protein CBP15_01765, partial [Fischerella thermalis WC442]